MTNSRPQKTRNQTWRRRLCKGCRAVFTSTESIDLFQALVVQKSGHIEPSSNRQTTKSVAKNSDLEPFDRDRLFISIYESLRHRSTAATDARGLTDTVVAQLISIAEHGRLNSRTIAASVMSTLQLFDSAGATHYAAFHKI